MVPSVVAHICSYNGESVLPQFFEKYDRLDPGPDHTIFIINNCTDKTYEILRDWNGTPKTIIPMWFVSDLIKRCRSEYAGLAIARQTAYDYLRAIKCPWDFVWQLDDDLLFRNSDSLETLLGWDLDVIGGTYWRDFPDGRFITAKLVLPDGSVSMSDKIVAPLMEPTVVGGGCILMRRKVAMDPRCYVYPLLGTAAEDFGFCLRIRDAGYDIFLDGIVMIDHLITRDRHDKAWTKRDDMLDWVM